MRQKINKGDKFLCVKDFFMKDGSLAFKEGRIYVSTKNNCITNNWNNPDHYMDKCDEFSDHFKSHLSDPKVLLQRILDLKNEY